MMPGKGSSRFGGFVANMLIMSDYSGVPSGYNCLAHNILIFRRVLPDICYPLVPVAGRGLPEK